MADVRWHKCSMGWGLLLVLLSLVSCQESRLDRIEREAKDYTLRNCPRRIDVITTLDSVVFRNDGSLDYIYYYTVSLDSLLLAEFNRHAADIEEKTLHSLRNSIERDVREIRDAGLNIIYIYKDSVTGKPLQTFRFTKEQYQ